MDPNLNQIKEINKNRLVKIEKLLTSLDKIEVNIENKININKKYTENLERDFKQIIDLYKSIHKNLSN